MRDYALKTIQMNRLPPSCLVNVYIYLKEDVTPCRQHIGMRRLFNYDVIMTIKKLYIVITYYSNLLPIYV